MITSKEYMADSANLHQAFFLQFATTATFNIVKSHIGVKAILASTDKYFNDIPLVKWDMLNESIKGSIDRETFRLAHNNWGGPDVVDGCAPKGSIYWSLSDGVCIAKAVARDIKATHETAQAKFAKA